MRHQSTNIEVSINPSSLKRLFEGHQQAALDAFENYKLDGKIREIFINFNCENNPSINIRFSWKPEISADGLLVNF